MTTPAIYSTLTAQAGLAALIGQRLYPSELPREITYPAVTFDVDVEAEDAHDDDLEGQFRTVFVEFSIYSRTTAAAADAIGEQIKAAFLNLSGVVDGLHYSGARFESADAPQFMGEENTWALDLRFSVMESPA